MQQCICGSLASVLVCAPTSETDACHDVRADGEETRQKEQGGEGQVAAEMRRERGAPRGVFVSEGKRGRWL
eukprot:3743077-Pleurochrysis_carterae.AAC.2